VGDNITPTGADVSLISIILGGVVSLSIYQTDVYLYCIIRQKQIYRS